MHKGMDESVGGSLWGDKGGRVRSADALSATMKNAGLRKDLSREREGQLCSLG